MDNEVRRSTVMAEVQSVKLDATDTILKAKNRLAVMEVICRSEGMVEEAKCLERIVKRLSDVLGDLFREL